MNTDTNTPSDIPDGERIPIEDTDLDVPALPGAWEWREANHYADFNGKVNVYFGKSVHSVGGRLGEIDNFLQDGDEVWALHVREILDAGEGNGTTPAETADTSEQFDTLHDAIAAVPEHIRTYYAADGAEESED